HRARPGEVRRPRPSVTVAPRAIARRPREHSPTQPGGATMRTRVTGIAELVTNDPAHAHHADPGDRLGVMHDAVLLVDDGRVVFAGPAAEAPSASSDETTVDAAGRSVIPGFVDSHNHLVFAGDRTAEFAARMSGQQYSAGGIRTTMTATRAATDD